MLSSVPKDWTVAGLSHFLDWITYGFTNPMPTTEVGPVKLTAKDIKDGKIDYSSARNTSKEAFDGLTDKSKPRINDVLLTKDGTIGRVAVVDRSNICINQSIALLRPNERIDPYFLKYLLQAPYYQNKMEMDTAGTTIKHIYVTKVDKMEVAVPPIEGQKKIVCILKNDDDLIEINSRSIQILEEIAQSLYHEWFIHFRFSGHENSEIRQTPQGLMPKGWELKKLGDISTIIMGQSPKSIYYNDEGKGLPFHQGVTDFGGMFPVTKRYSTQGNRVAEPHDILLSVRAPVGRMNIANTKMILGRGLCGIKSKAENQIFLYEQLKQIFHEEDIMGGGTIFKAVTKQDVHNIKVISPEKDVTKKFQELAKPIYDEIEILSNKNDVLRKSRDLVLPRLISGEIDVNKLDAEISGG